jgi:uncharacterized heparinase superfamily protein
VRKWPQIWTSPRYMSSQMAERGAFTFLGMKGDVSCAADWNRSDRSKLWLYNLHYLDDLNAVEADARFEENCWLVNRWVSDNKIGVGNGWEPYPLSLRLVNLIKWLSRNKINDSSWVGSVEIQAYALSLKLERHLLANHLFENAKSLVFAGAFFSGDHAERWLNKGLCLLDVEIREQFLDDGGNYELSPMYHSIMLWGICDLLLLAQITDIPQLLERVGHWQQVLEKGMHWLSCMIHPDRNVSFFNDCAIGVAPNYKDLKGYSSLVGCLIEPCAEIFPSLFNLKDSGYVVIRPCEGATLIMDVGNIGPSYQPGHAHADTLSFEFSVYSKRLIVNSGTSEYGNSPERSRQRGTPAHNTICVNGINSSDVWAGFRVGRRAKPFGLSLERVDDRHEIRCSHDGYRFLSDGVIHTRTWTVAPGVLTVFDEVVGSVDHAIAYFHLHPDVKIVGDGVLQLGEGELIRFSVSTANFEIQKSSWHPFFGSSVECLCIAVALHGSFSRVEFNWDM